MFLTKYGFNEHIFMVPKSSLYKWIVLYCELDMYFSLDLCSMNYADLEFFIL